MPRIRGISRILTQGTHSPTPCTHTLGAASPLYRKACCAGLDTVIAPNLWETPPSGPFGHCRDLVCLD